MNKFVAALKLAETAFVLLLTFLPACCVALAQDSSNPPGEKSSEENLKTVHGAESDFTSGSAWRGLVISDRPVVSNAGWVSKCGVSDKNELEISFDTGRASSTFNQAWPCLRLISNKSRFVKPATATYKE